ncbi:MAG: alpha/beta hydrolase [Sediminibacterium sp.]|nr:alpha/beta hydrolase [Sediminibacterium sp.]MDP3128237.1 alpha/beta hydrolase [Sediminibacterium sp.]
MTNFSFITLPDGRRLSYLEFGEANGHPVFYFHGAPSSCLEPLLIGNEVFIEHGLRVIAPNRPGIGQSDFQINREFNNWPDDVLSLADHLKLDKFSLFGNSGGGGYVTACAAMIAERLHSAVVVSGGWQMNLPEAKKNLKFPFSLFWTVAAKWPFLLPFLLGTMKSSPKESKEKGLAQAKKMMPAPDYEALILYDRAEVLARALDEALLNKKGVAWDLRLYVKKFDFNLSEITFPITFFHGEVDKNMPIELVKKMVIQIPNAKLITYENDAHLSALCNHFNEAAQAILNGGGNFNGPLP